ncbi:hypothetical protein TS65_21970 [Aneurinibacillus migulanus]|uniref:Uncharacterized protein n=1 Tax=Aneurinibacillus migulanus TaxID=47500 RepID=A0A0D1Y0J9_ANEMI|nr:hypothetical protein TS65_21970 [Aneurinibacillus migulanus]KON95072.1 hypothetical protein AF333_05825 [Aneurinibacillus migulanus]
MEKEENGYALRPGRKKADVSFSDRSRPPPFILFLSLTTRICRFIKSDVYNKYTKNRSGAYILLYSTLGTDRSLIIN